MAKWAPKWSKIPSSRDFQLWKKCFGIDDRMSNTKNICQEIYLNILNYFEEIEKHDKSNDTEKWPKLFVYKSLYKHK